MPANGSWGDDPVTPEEFEQIFGFRPRTPTLTPDEAERAKQINQLFDDMWARFSLNTLKIFELALEANPRETHSTFIDIRGNILSCPQAVIDYCQARLYERKPAPPKPPLL
jgi:hypothetical protein